MSTRFECLKRERENWGWFSGTLQVWKKSLKKRKTIFLFTKWPILTLKRQWWNPTSRSTTLNCILCLAVRSFSTSMSKSWFSRQNIWILSHQLFMPFITGPFRLRRHSIGQSCLTTTTSNNISDVDNDASLIKRRSHYGSFGGFADSVHPLCLVLPDHGDPEPSSSGFVPFSRNRLPPPPPPPPPASRNDMSSNGFGKTMTVIEVNWNVTNWDDPNVFYISFRCQCDQIWRNLATLANF